MNEEQGPKTDAEGRIIDSTGRPLRDKRSRTYSGAFMGKSGKPNPVQKKLDMRIAQFESEQGKSNKTGRKRPGSLNRNK